jgi:hypothetical protein
MKKLLTALTVALLASSARAQSPHSGPAGFGDRTYYTPPWEWFQGRVVRVNYDPSLSWGQMRSGQVAVQQVQPAPQQQPVVRYAQPPQVQYPQYYAPNCNT